MATGRAFRARPLDFHKPLEIVRDESLLDSTEGLPAREVVHNHAALDAENEKPKMIKQENAKGGKEIPIPGITRVPTYHLDYLPTYREKNTYLRGRGGTDYDDPTLVEYDLDSEDEAWLRSFNGPQERLPAEKFETMLWKLDVANAEATDKVFSFQGTAAAERLSIEACATTDHFQREDALQMLQELCPSRDTFRVAVYDYWLRKRAALGRPLLRRLMAPTPQNNQDPYRVFRPREKIHRPQTRRRRENNPDSLDKLHTISDNMRVAMTLFELVVKRERKKRDMTYVVTDWQQLQIKQRHEPKADQDTIEQAYQAAVKSKNVPRRPLGFDELPEAAPAATNALLDFRNKKNKKRKKLGQEALMNAVAQMAPPPVPPQPQLLCTWAPEALRSGFEEGKLKVPPHADGGKGHRWTGRIGRGGRLVFDRCTPFTWEPLDAEHDEDLKPMHQLTNPYAQWSSKNELAQAAMARLDGAAPPSTVVKLRITSKGNTPTPAGAAAAEDVNMNETPQENNGQPGVTPALGKRTSARQRGTT